MILPLTSHCDGILQAVYESGAPLSRKALTSGKLQKESLGSTWLLAIMSRSR